MNNAVGVWANVKETTTPGSETRPRPTPETLFQEWLECDEDDPCYELLTDDDIIHIHMTVLNTRCIIYIFVG